MATLDQNKLKKFPKAEYIDFAIDLIYKDVIGHPSRKKDEWKFATAKEIMAEFDSWRIKNNKNKNKVHYRPISVKTQCEYLNEIIYGKNKPSGVRFNIDLLRLRCAMKDSVAYLSQYLKDCKVQFPFLSGKLPDFKHVNIFGMNPKYTSSIDTGFSLPMMVVIIPRAVDGSEGVGTVQDLADNIYRFHSELSFHCKWYKVDNPVAAYSIGFRCITFHFYDSLSAQLFINYFQKKFDPVQIVLSEKK